MRLLGRPGPDNAITDVAGVEVGHRTLIGDLPDGARVRTGVTAILPRSARDFAPVFCATSVLNGTGELTGAHAVEETGLLYGPLALTTSTAVGVVRDAIVGWLARNDPDYVAALPMVGETWDGILNDIDGFHLTAADAIAAIDAAGDGPVPGGAVGAGTGTVAYDLKAGIGTASRVVGPYTLGALVQANQGSAEQLVIDGVPVGRLLGPAPARTFEAGSIVMVLATDAPLLPDQLKRLARRAPLGLARTGATSGPFSGDFAIAFSTAPTPPARFVIHAEPEAAPQAFSLQALDGADLAGVARAVAEVVEEAILDALFRASDAVGTHGTYVPALPIDATLDLLRRHGRL